jgi:hypothetical protein
MDFTVLVDWLEPCGLLNQNMLTLHLTDKSTDIIQLNDTDKSNDSKQERIGIMGREFQLTELIAYLLGVKMNHIRELKIITPKLLDQN